MSLLHCYYEVLQFGTGTSVSWISVSRAILTRRILIVNMWAQLP